MVRRFHRSIYDELDELKASMDYLFQLAFEPTDNPLLPQGEDPGIVCRNPHNLNAEVVETADEVIVTLETVPVTGPTTISVDLVDRYTLKIACEWQEETGDGGAVDTLSEERSLSLNHEIPLPVPVMKCGARSTLKNGVLDLHLKKIAPARA